VMASSVKVAVRVRPFNARETNRNAKCVIQMQDKSTCKFTTHTHTETPKVMGLQYGYNRLHPRLHKCAD
uniref:Kinesin motor domain-containing protein n=1 Tax=Astyanax mexicanus TaxID=7994 RepID=A0A3B1J7B6_ASTMX